MGHIEGDAAGSRPQSRSRHMDEYCAATVRNPGPGIVIELDDQVIEVIIAPQPVAGCMFRSTDRPVVASIRRILAPGVGSVDAAHRQSGARTWTAIGAPPHLTRPESSLRRRPVAFTLVGANAGSPERGSASRRIGENPATRRQARSRPDVNKSQGCQSHTRKIMEFASPPTGPWCNCKFTAVRPNGNGSPGLPSWISSRRHPCAAVGENTMMATSKSKCWPQLALCRPMGLRRSNVAWPATSTRGLLQWRMPERS